MKLGLNHYPDPFAPNVRGSIGLIKLASRQTTHDLIKIWKTKNHTYADDHDIRAKPDKPLEMRRAHARIYQVTQAIKEAVGVMRAGDVDSDFRKLGVWVGSHLVVTWMAD
eukprot:2273727-Prorocentrum_lima.AAC.1